MKQGKSGFVSAGEITAAVERKRIKNIYIRVADDGEVRISAPLHTPDSELERFLCSRLGWVAKCRERVAAIQPASTPRFVSGERHALWGKQYTLSVKTAAWRRSVSLDEPGGRIIMYVRSGDNAERRAEVLRQWYKERLSGAASVLAARYEPLMGVSTQAWRFREMCSRWGSCNVKSRTVCLNLRLAKMPPECLEYVTVHELAHLIEPSHNARFWATVERYFPDWKRVRRSMR